MKEMESSLVKWIEEAVLLHFRVLANAADAREMADILKGSGITGIRRVTRECPVARYLYEELSPYVVIDHVSFCGPWATVWLDEEDYTVVDVPEARVSLFKDFVAEFDGGSYPELEEEEEA